MSVRRGGNRRPRIASLRRAINLTEPLEPRLLLAVISWDGGPSGNGTNFATPSNWAGDVAPGVSDTAVLDATGTSPLISIISSVSVAAIQTSRALQLSGAGAAINNASISGTGTLALSSGILNGVTLGIDATVANGNSVRVDNGLTFANDASITLNGTSTSTRLDFGGSQTIDGTGEIVLAGEFAEMRLGVFGSSMTLTIAASVTVRGRGSIAQQSPTLNTILNHGTLQADVNGQTLIIQPTNFDNTGTLRGINGGDLSLRAAATTLDSTGTVDAAGGRVILSQGTVNNGADTIMLNGGTAQLTFHGGTISGGTIAASNGGGVFATGGTFSGVTLSGSGSFTGLGGGGPTFTNGLTLINGATLTFRALTFSGTQTVSGTGFIELPQAFTPPFDISVMQVSNGTLTIGSGVTVRGAGSIARGGSFGAVVNQGTILSNINGQGIAFAGSSFTFSNAGTVMAQGTAKILVNVMNPDLADNTLHGGTWRALNSSEMSFGGTVTGNATTIEVGSNATVFLSGLHSNAGTLTLSSGGDLPLTPTGGTLTNSGTINLSPGSALNVTGSFAQTGAGTLHTNLASADPTTGFGRLTASGPIFLDGTLTATLLNSYDPPEGTEFAVATGSTRAGEFATFTGGPTISGAPLSDEYDDEETTAFIIVGPPTLPSPPDLDLGSDSGSSNSDNYTNDATPTFSGVRATPGNTLRIYSDGNLVGSETVDGSGNWSVTTSPLAQGAHVITARQFDGVNETPIAGSLNITIDTAAPVLTNPGDQTYTISNTAGTPVNFTPATASDNLTPSPTVVHNPPAVGSSFLPGSTNVIATATDLAGNQAQTSFNINLVDPPYIQRGPGGAYRLLAGPTLIIDGGEVRLIADAANTTPNLTVASNQQSGTLVIDASQHLQMLNVNAQSLARMTAGPKVLVLKQLLVANQAVFDLNDSSMIVDYEFSNPNSIVQGYINSGRAGGTWTGEGMISTAAKNASPRNTTLGVLEASEFKSINGPSATFAGETIDNTAVLVKYTYYGDADFNGAVNFDDYSRTDAGFNQGRTGWLNGDFDGNGSVNFDDYSLIDLAFNTQGGGLRAGRGAGKLPAAKR